MGTKFYEKNQRLRYQDYFASEHICVKLCLHFCDYMNHLTIQSLRKQTRHLSLFEEQLKNYLKSVASILPKTLQLYTLRYSAGIKLTPLINCFFQGKLTSIKKKYRPSLF